MKSTDLADVQRRLWTAADQLRANSSLSPVEYRGPVLGLIFLAYAEHRVAALGKRLRTDRVTPAACRAAGVLHVPDEARLSYLVDLPSGALGRAVDTAMRLMEDGNDDLRGVLPTGYHRLDSALLGALLRLFAPLPRLLSGDAFGLIYEDFLSKLARAEGRLGGEFFTPHSIVRLIVEVIEPYHGRVFDPACGSGGMFVQCATFVERRALVPARALSIYGQEQKESTVPLARMNLALHGLSGDIRPANTYYEDPHDSVGAFDFVMANPPFNVNKVDKAKLVGDPRLPFGLPRPDNANYLWIQHCYAALAPRGRAGFVMANAAADAPHSEREIRRRLIESGAVDVMVAVGPNFFYTVTLPSTLWFLDKGKAATDRADRVLFVDARQLFRRVDRAHRDFTPAQIELLANVVRLYRGDEPEHVDGSDDLMEQHFPDGRYADVPGLCRVATIAEIAEQGWSLNPGRYTGVAPRDEADDAFAETFAALYADLTRLGDEADALRARVDGAVRGLLDR